MEFKKVLAIAQIIIMIFYGCYTTILAIDAFLNVQTIKEKYLTIIDNYKLDPLASVSIRTGASDCNPDEQLLFYYDWQGTIEGCNCLTTKSPPCTGSIYCGDTYDYQCYDNQTSHDCTPINAIPGARMSKFLSTDGGVSYKVCGKRIPGYNFKDKHPAKLSCASNENACGTNKESFYCVPNTLGSCPVMDLKEGGATKPNSDNEYQGLVISAGPTVQNLYYKEISATTTELPIVDFRITEGPGVCFPNTNKRATVSGTTEFYLMAEKRSPCDEFDSGFVPALVSKEDKFFEANGLHTALNSLPLNSGGVAALSATDEYKAYVKRMVPWKFEYRDKVTRFIGTKSDITNMINCQLLIMIFNIISMVLISIILQSMEVYNLCGKDVPCIPGTGEEEKKRIKTIKQVINYIGKILQLPFTFLAFVVANKNKTYFQLLADNKISDSQTNGILDEMSKLITKDIWQNDLQMMVLFVVFLILDVILFIVDYRKKKKAALSQVQPKKDEESVLPQKDASETQKLNEKDKKYENNKDDAVNLDSPDKKDHQEEKSKLQIGSGDNPFAK